MNIVKKILLIIIVFLSILLLNETNSEAKAIPFGTNQVTVDINGLLWHTPNGYDLTVGAPGEKTYCILHGQNVYNSTKYNVRNYVRIEGKKSQFYVNNYNDRSHLLAEHINDENLMISWMLNHGDQGSIMYSKADEKFFTTFIPTYDPNSSLWVNGGGNKRYSINQVAVYGFFPIWAQANDYTIPCGGGGYSSSEWERRAREYVNSDKTQTVSIQNNTDKNNLTKEIITYSGAQYIKIGAFNISYVGTFTNNVGVYNQDNTKVSVKYAKYNGNTLEVYDDINSAAKSGQNFYILVPTNAGISKINKINFEVSQNTETLITDMWILEHDDGQKYQNLITVQTYDPITKTESLSIEITDIELFGGLIINKTDADTGDALANVGFRLKMTSGAKAGQYVGVDGNGNAYYSSSPTDMRTNSNGQLIINSLYAGTYELTESVNPYFGYIKQPVVVASGIVVNAGQVTPQYVTNRKQYANLLIRKTDEDTTSAMSNVQFTLQKIGGTNAGQYVSLDGNGNAVYSSSVQYLTTSGNGRIFINYLYAGTYKLTETYNPNYGYEDTPKVITSNLTLTGGQVRTYDVTNKQIYGKLIIVKTDKDTGKKLSNIKFTIQKTSGEKNGQYVSVDANGNAVYSTTAKTVTTNSEGRVEIDKMLGGTYKIVETSNPYYGYERVPITISSGRQVVVGETRTADLTNELVYGKLKITKTDADTGEKMSNVGFTLRMTSGKKAGQYVSVNSSGEAVYSTTPSTLRTDSNGEININYIYKGTYELVETVNPYFGYEDLPRVITSNLVVTAGENVTTYSATNRRKYIKVSGYAWEDKTDGKGSNKDYEWKQGTEDKRLQNITVTLKKADGTVLDTAVTDANGAYIFGNYDTDSSAVKIKIDDLQGAYIEFEYNGMSYQSIPINSSFTLSNSKINGVKNSATDTSLRNNFNKNYATISKGQSQNTSGQKTYNIKYTYSDYKSKVVYGDSVKYGYKGQSYPISGVYAQYKITATTNKNSGKSLCTQYTANDIRKNSVEEIAGINLGLEEREMPDLNVSEQDLEKIEIQLNNYTHTYKYGQVSADPNGFAGGDVSNIAVRFASKYFNSSYTREIYTSDVVYNAQAGNEGKLKMYMTYKIELTNEATSLNSTVKTIANYYDDRYENISVTDQNGKAINYQIDNSYHVNGLKKMNINVNQTLGPQTSKTITVRYQLNNDAINALLNGNATLNSITEITSYSTYQNNSFSTPYAGIDVDSAPDTVTPNNRNTYEDDTNWAPSLILTLKEGRIIKGTVWEDAPLEDLLEGTGYDKHRIGDGQYQSAENIVNNVKVDLMTVDDSGNVALGKLYKKDDTVVDATTTTGGKGEYSFVGVIPGKYLIRYTYGDNSVICDTNGNVIKNVDADNYKSTIYRGGNKSAVNAMTDYWYRGETSHEGAIRLSDAKDNDEYVNERITEEEFNYATASESRDITEIAADTRRFEIKLDYDINLDNISEYGADLKFVFDNIDFGIIERPRQSLLINKEISNIQVTLANGVTLINGDPRSQNISGLKMLPNGDVHIEIDDEVIQGATLRITYEITVDNKNCEIDYNDEDYYIYGTVPADKENKYRITTIVDMFDYLPEDLVLESTDGNWESIEITPDMKGQLFADDVYEVVKNLQNIIHLKNPIFENMEPGSEAVDTTMVVSKQLSVSSDDLTYENDIEVIKLKGRKTIDSIPGNYDPTTNTPNEPDDDYVGLTITGPTGDNRQYILYGAIGIGILVVVGVGIVIIKRKVLRK